MIPDKILSKIKVKQKCIVSSEDLRGFGYHHGGYSKSTGTLMWALDSWSKEKFHIYYLKNKKELLKKKIAYFKTEKGKEAKKKSDLKYQKNHKEQIKKKQQEYSKTHAEEIRRRVCEWQKIHPEQRNANHRWWAKNHPEKVKENHNQRRNMRFIPLNKPIDGIECDAHHVDENHILYIPKEIHKQSHNLKDRELIAKVNGDFLIWLGKRKNIKVI